MTLASSGSHPPLAGRSWLLVGLAWLLCAPTLSWAAEDSAVGLIKTLQGQVHVERAGQRLPAQPGQAVHRLDRIVTGHPGGVGITLLDDSLVTLGPGSQLELSEVRFEPTTQQGRLWIRLVRGMVHVVTGLIARESPQNVRIETPTAVMGVRGTEFIVETRGAP